VQVDPIKPTLKAPGTEHLKLKHEGLLSNVGFKFNLRRYTEGGQGRAGGAERGGTRGAGGRQGLTLVHFSSQLKRSLWDKGCLGGV